MFILFGAKTRFKTLSTGQFYCPQCRARQTYALRLARDYFTLYFIPLWPIKTRGEVVTCQTCGTNFQKEVLAVLEPANSPLERMTREARADRVCAAEAHQHRAGARAGRSNDRAGRRPRSARVPRRCPRLSIHHRALRAVRGGLDRSLTSGLNFQR